MTKEKSRGRIIGQNIRSKCKEISHWIPLYVDDSAFILPTRDDVTKTANLVLVLFKTIALQIHADTAEKKSKTEVLHIPKKGTESNTANTAPIILSDGTWILFNSSFTYLGYIISSLLSDKEDILNHVSKAIKVFGSLRALIFGNPYYLPLKIKQYLYVAIAGNLLLWGCYNWALSVRMTRRLESFHTTCCRAILGISMREVSMYKVKNRNILARLNMPNMKNLIHYRRLLWMQKIAVMPFNRYPKIFLNAWISSNYPVGRPYLTTCDSFLK